MKFPKFFGIDIEDAQQPEKAAGRCRHKLLSYQWDRWEDMGQPDRVMSYRCNGCGAVFTRKEAEHLSKRAHAITL